MTTAVLAGEGVPLFLVRLDSKNTTGYIGSSGRLYQALTSAITASVTELMNSGLTSVPYCSARNPRISRTAMPRAYFATM